MNKFIWLVGATCLGVAAYVLLSDIATRDALEMDGADEASARTGLWGTKQRASGLGRQLGGRLKEGAGWVTGDRGLQGEGALDELGGKVQDLAGQAAHAVSGAIDDLKH